MLKMQSYGFGYNNSNNLLDEDNNGSALKTYIVKDIEMKEKPMDSKVTINHMEPITVITIGEMRKGSCFAVNETVSKFQIPMQQ